MKTLFIGDLNAHTESKSKCDAFIDIGWDVTALSSEKIPHLPGLGAANGFRERLKRKFFPMHDANQINATLKQLSVTEVLNEFDLVWSDKAINLQPSVIKLMKDKCPRLKLVFASGDNVALPAFRNKAFEDSIHLFDAVITTKSATKTQLYDLGAKYVHYIPKAFDERWPLYLKRPKKKWDVSFVGSFEHERARSILSLASSGQVVNIWGNGWKSLVGAHPNLIVHGYPVYFEDLINVIECSKINLCFLRKLANDKSTNRTFEIPACGGFMLAESSEEQKQFFAPDTSAVFFSDDSELTEKCAIFLEDDGRREAIADAGHNKCLNSGYGYTDRCRQFITEVMPLI